MTDDDSPWYSLALPILLTFMSVLGGGLLIFAYLTKNKLEKSYAGLRAKAEEMDEDHRRRRKMKSISKARPSKQIKSRKVGKSKSSSKTGRDSQRSARQSSARSQSTEDSPTPTVSNQTQALRAAIEAEGRVDINAIVKMKNTLGFTTDDWRILIRKVTPFLQEFTDHVEQYPTSRIKLPGFLYNALPHHMPDQPWAPEETWRIFKDHIFTGMCFWQHPRFFGYFPINRSIPDTLAELLIGALSIPMSDFDACPALADLEAAMVNWAGRALGLPEELLYHGDAASSKSGGFFVESASESIFSAVMVARARKIQEIFVHNGLILPEEHFFYSVRTRNRHDVIHDIAGKLVVYANREAHSSIDKGCNMAVVRHRPLPGDPACAFALTGAILEKAILEDMAKGLIPCMVHATVGTTSSCAYDKLEEIGEVCKKYGLWFHLDGAYGGSMWVEPKFRDTQKGIKYVDSVDINLHKALLHSISTSLLWTRDQRSFRMAFATIDPKKSKPTNGYNVAESAIHDSRRHRALKVWFTFRWYGLEGLRAHINNVCAMAIYLQELMSNHENVRMFGTPAPGFFSWQYVEPGFTEEQINYNTSKFRTYLNETGDIYVTNSTVQNREIIRMCVHYTKICPEDMQDCWERLKGHLKIYKERKDDPQLIRFPPASPMKTALPIQTPPRTPSVDASFHTPTSGLSPQNSQ